MATGTGPISFSFYDSKNFVSKSRYFWSPASTLATVGAFALGMTPLLQALSNANTFDPLGAAAAPVQGSGAEFPTAEDKMEITFQTASGALHRYQIPAPKSAKFLADNETVNFADTDVTAYVNYVIANVSSRDGDPITAAVGGMRVRVKLQRKFNIRSRNPLTTGQGL